MASHQDLIELLQQREKTIADHAWRDHDQAGHLNALRQVSEQISGWPDTADQPPDPKLRHFLQNASYTKALAHLQQLQ